MKSKQRVADHGEVFTPPQLAESMIGLVKGEAERVDSRFLEPACGSGNFPGARASPQARLSTPATAGATSSGGTMHCWH